MISFPLGDIRNNAFLKRHAPLHLAAVAVSIFLVLVGCNGSSKIEEGPPADSLATVEKDASVDVTDVVIDATPSMRGFADGPRYQNFVTQSLANASVGSGRVEYHQLTTALPGGLQAVDQKMRAAESTFYARGNTELSTALDSLDGDGLTVLLTDLFQSSADMNAVSRAIARQAFDQGLAVGVIASRFQFDGRIYDVGPDGRAFDFNGQRPLYGLVFGLPRAVSDYFENLREFVDPERYHFLLFSSRVAEQPGRVQIRDSDPIRNLVRVKPQADVPLPSTQTLGLRIQNNNTSARLGAQLDLDILPDVQPLLSSKSLAAKVTKVWKRDAQSGTYVGEFEERSRAKGALGIRAVQNDSSRLRLRIRPEDLRRGFYTFNTTVDVREWELPQWVSDWNLPPSEFQAETPDGSKTANLHSFLLDLGSGLTNTGGPRVAALQAYVEKQ
ncbi:hypothetical protein [Salinibacter ruber]|uniref:hypothetical protein n=1 Tax=Salinibacter ruber TaxID=146919 RepID=UPI0021683C18|nr:hypothetical protein [Salinibacter ruber]MCS4099896.1 hypothetical protein [Salinibacter ruber]